MRSRLVALLLLALVLVAGSLSWGAPAVATAGADDSTSAAAAARGCVERSEYRRVKRGMSQATVHRIFGTKGKRESISSGGGQVFEVRSYKACTRFDAVAVGYQNKKLRSKSATF